MSSISWHLRFTQKMLQHEQELEVKTSREHHVLVKKIRKEFKSR
jgi:hypothetical protein